MTEPPRGHRPLDHTADAGLEAWGPTFGSACAEAAVALFEVMGRPSSSSSSPETSSHGASSHGAPFDQTSAGIDRGDAVVRLLTDLLGRFETEGRFVTSAECVAEAIRAGGVEVTLRCDGVVVDRTRERALAEVKAVTYHGLRVVEEPDRVVVRVYLDL